MKSVCARVLCVCALLVVCFATVDLPVARGELKAGAATSNITPPLGGSIVGGFLPVPSRHIHDELHARCLVLDDGNKKLALVVCDLLGFHRGVSDAARQLIEQRLGIPASNVLISATHTHSAMSALGRDRFQFQSELDDYQQFVVERIVDGVQRAGNLLRPAELAFGSVDVPEHVFNRRWFMKPGTVPPNPFGGTDRVKMNPPGGSPNLEEPAGPTDPTVSFISVREVNGPLVGLYAAYSLHYVGGVGPGHVSADYFAMFCEEVIRLQGLQDQDPPFVPMMANGTSGNINNINFREPRPRKAAYEQMRYVAHDVAARVSSELKNLNYASQVTLDAAYAEFEVGWRVPSEEQLSWASGKLAEPESAGRGADLPR
ncbi:MAG: neutral/alkaline non-lysosomal ceramidase N-terminal domain-containing protein, partial [Planctomycetaceae bacterium]|nr:neutral/alkaline non-lysosomal ceramidase N-terminal domain-containing protein [Planctomycetaceae bacterium]